MAVITLNLPCLCCHQFYHTAFTATQKAQHNILANWKMNTFHLKPNKDSYKSINLDSNIIKDHKTMIHILFVLVTSFHPGLMVKML